MNDDMLMFEKRCEGCSRGIPVRVFPEAVTFYKSCMPIPPPSLRVMTYRCKCRTFTVITVADLLEATCGNLIDLRR